MNILLIPEEDRIKVDLHGFTKEEAKYELLNMLDTIPNNIKAIIVVHGYSGSILLNFVRKELKHKRIKEKISNLNPGITVLKLDTNYYISLKKVKRKKRKKKRFNKKI